MGSQQETSTARLLHLGGLSGRDRLYWGFCLSSNRVKRGMMADYAMALTAFTVITLNTSACIPLAKVSHMSKLDICSMWKYSLSVGGSKGTPALGVQHREDKSLRLARTAECTRGL